jgi:hypothetical protein
LSAAQARRQQQLRHALLSISGGAQFDTLSKPTRLKSDGGGNGLKETRNSSGNVAEGAGRA